MHIDGSSPVKQTDYTVEQLAGTADATQAFSTLSLVTQTIPYTKSYTAKKNYST